MTSNRKVDHLVYAVPNLMAAMDIFEQKTGIRPIFGGYHQNQGTKNALVNLGDKCYLEFIAIDTKNTAIQAPRWMGVDFVDSPQITRWALKSENLEKDSRILQHYQADLGQIQAGQRKMSNGKTLTWQMSMPLATPAVDILPFFLDWRQSEAHPTEALPVQCRLVRLELAHPQANTMQRVFEDLSLDLNILQQANPSIGIQLECPRGLINL